MMTKDEPNNEEQPDFSGVTGGASTSATGPEGKPVEAEVNEIYEVVSGDSLSKIAKRKYGDAGLWKRIYEANTDLIKNPDVIQIGWKLKIPAVPAEAPTGIGEGESHA
jgi:nucleoid-associated protein YgaU